MLKFFSILISAILLTALQIGFWPGFNPNLSLFINLPLLFILILAFFGDFETNLTSALLLGLFLDLYSPLFFGFFILLLMSQFLVSRFFLRHVFQNKRLRSLIALNLIVILYWQFIYFLTFFILERVADTASLELATPEHFSYLVYQIIIHSLIIVMLYKFFPGFKSNLTADLVA